MPSIVGTWKMNFSWGCSTSYSSIPSFVFNAGGTWSGGASSGKWVQNEGMLILNINGVATIYTGNIAGHAMSGTSTTFAGLNGCWYATRVGVAAAAASKGARANFAGSTASTKSASKKSSKKKK